MHQCDHVTDQYYQCNQPSGSLCFQHSDIRNMGPEAKECIYVTPTRPAREARSSTSSCRASLISDCLVCDSLYHSEVCRVIAPPETIVPPNSCRKCWTVCKEREQGSEGARQRGSEGARERGSAGTRERMVSVSGKSVHIPTFSMPLVLIPCLVLPY